MVGWSDLKAEKCMVVNAYMCCDHLHLEFVVGLLLIFVCLFRPL